MIFLEKPVFLNSKNKVRVRFPSGNISGITGRGHGSQPLWLRVQHLATSISSSPCDPSAVLLWRPTLSTPVLLLVPIWKTVCLPPNSKANPTNFKINVSYKTSPPRLIPTDTDLTFSLPPYIPLVFSPYCCCCIPII